MATYKLVLDKLLSTATKPRPHAVYENNQRTDQIDGYVYRLIDIDSGEAISVRIPQKKDIPPKRWVKVANPVGTPYVRNGYAQMSIKADDLIIVKGGTQS
ncbi:hypothetical protein EWH99_13395 [Sporolactobacillus sp. THM7-7]|jgi:hypothetical protein|nr:hypothetical protein EWH99_13395 [Sporolactobacillus sp. THM7-7]